MGDAAQSTRGFGSRLGGIAKTAGLVVGGAALGGVAIVLKRGLDEWKESAKVMAQTGAVLKSTGGAAGVTAEHVGNLAEAIMRKSGIDDEAIQSGENLLLTFTNIRNEVGKGNDIFDQTTRVMADMSTALGQDMKSSAVQLGKALNDPVRGVTALQRVGVSFTKSQKEQIKSLVESGHAMDAQKLILRELNKEFGGSAEAVGKTLPGQISILKESFNNLAGQIFANLVPALQRVVTWTAEHWPEIEATIKAVFDAIGYAITNIIKPAIESLITAGRFVVDWFRANWPQISSTFMEVFNTVKAIVMGAVAVLEDMWNRYGSTILAQTRATWNYIKETFEAALNVIRGIVNVIGGLLQGDFSRVWEGIKQIFTGAFQQLTALVRFGLETIMNLMRAAGTAMLAMMSDTWALIRAATAAAFDAIVGVIRNAVGKAVAAATALAVGVKEAVMRPIETIADAVEKVFRTVVQTIAGMVGAAGAAARALGSAIYSGIKAGLGPIVAFLEHIASLLRTIAGILPGGGGGPSPWDVAVGIGNGNSPGGGGGAPGGRGMSGRSSGRTASAGGTVNITLNVRAETDDPQRLAKSLAPHVHKEIFRLRRDGVAVAY